MPTSADEDFKIIGFDPAGTNEVTSEHPASTNTTTTASSSSNQRNIPKIGRGVLCHVIYFMIWNLKL